MEKSTERQDIAIIGTSCRLPGNASSPSKLWELLLDPKTVSGPIPGYEGYYHQNGKHHGHANVRTAYLLSEDGFKRRFDASFFGVNPVEANAMDPQVRLTLETVYEALEAGGQRMDALRGSNTAVYIGHMVSDYEAVIKRDMDTMPVYCVTGTSRTMISSRVSYFFDWHGPSLTIDTACSSSLTALHQAVQQLRSGQSDIAVVAAANLIFDMSTFIAMSKLQMLSPNSQCRMWDAAADGYARGDGVAAVVLKLRRAAEADGDDIECVIRETALNQDGKTTGPSMPSPSAQAQLIRDCYRRAGLDLSNPAHRPQFFEAHGTGTPAGDPVEAEAIHSALFDSDNGEQNRLLVGSIKTVIGHTEAAAGLAGLLKASLAMKHATVPPNMLFDNLNPAVAPFYMHLRIPKSPTPWPVLQEGVPRRASVNSFGFGGANAHVILENYRSPTTQLLEQGDEPRDIFTPFVFSAASKSSLKSYLANFSQHMGQRSDNTQKTLRDIAYTLFARRTALPVATTISARSFDELVHQVKSKLEAIEISAENHVFSRTFRNKPGTSWKPRVLGVFTGQGAQWPQMGLDLILASPKLRDTIERLQSRLRMITNSPTWSLLEELQKDASSSRIMNAEISQPLCTTVQILQVDFIRAAGIEFHTVVGHSSGEIVAAYAAGYVSAEDAVCIAYYRGLCSSFAKGHGGKDGGMMAVGTTLEDAEDLLAYPEFEGRACVAAVNSATSVTLSGDRDAIEELLVIFQDEKKFARILQVDTAYHSSHMLGVSAKYLDVLAALNIRVGPGSKTHWFSSVTGCKMTSNPLEQLEGAYWVRNMNGRVSFLQAIDSACRDVDHFDLAMEIGPHPALRDPTLETIQSRYAKSLPYTGLFRRRSPAITSVASGLGFAWIHLGGDNVSLKEYNEHVSGVKTQFKVVKDLPAYAWNHEDEYWYESRQARAIRLRSGPVHELLGHLTPDSTPEDMRWRNVLRVTELRWLMDHKIQNVVVFPATGYIVSVLEAAMLVCPGCRVRKIILSDMEIHSATVFERNDVNVETLLSLSDVKRSGNRTIEAAVKYHAASGRDADRLELKFSCHVSIELNEPSPNNLPCRPPPRSNLNPVRQEQFYEMLSRLEYGYRGQFATLNEIRRKLGAVTGFVDIIEKTSFLIHPGALDAAFQAILLLHVAPDDGECSKIHIPRRLGKLTVDPNICAMARDNQTRLAIDASRSIQNSYPTPNMVCDIDLYPADGENPMIQTQGLECVRISKATVDDDIELFSNILWDVAEPDARSTCHDLDPRAVELAHLAEETASVILKVLQETQGQQHYHVNTCHKHLFEHLILCSAKRKEASREVVSSEGVPYAQINDMKRILELGDELANLISSKTIVGSPVEDVQGNWISQSEIFNIFAHRLAQVVKQLAHRNPHMNIMEVATKADACKAVTKAVTGTIRSTFATYTLVDTDKASFELQAEPSKWLQENGVMSKHVDISSADSWEQAFTEESYDLIIASVGVCSVPDIRSMFHNVRRFVQPGGYLLIFMPSAESALGTLFNAYLQWWLGGDNSSATMQPALTIAQWDTLLRETGFSGVDSSSAGDSFKGPFSIAVSQAMDSRIAMLRDPLPPFEGETTQEVKFQNLLVLSGKEEKSNHISHQVSNVLAPYFDRIDVISSLADVLAVDSLDHSTTLLSLTDIEGSIFTNLDEIAWDALRKVLLGVGTLMWVTNDCASTNCHANMMLGLVRAAARDNPTLDYVLFDIESCQYLEHMIIAKTLLRHKILGHWRQRDERIPISLENELILNKEGKLIIPRLIANTELNNRYNSNYRPICTNQRSNGTQNFCLVPVDSGWEVVVRTPQPHTQTTRSDLIQLCSTHSLLSAIRVSDYGFMFLALGRDSASNGLMVYLSPENSLKVYAHKDLSIPVKMAAGSEEALLMLVAHHLLASLVLEELAADEEVLVYEPSADFASILLEAARAKGIKVTFAKTIAGNLELQGDGWTSTTMQPEEPRRVMAELMQREYLAFVDMLPHSDNAGDYIRSLLPAGCKSYGIASLFGNVGRGLSNSRRHRVASKLATAVAMASHTLASHPHFKSSTTALAPSQVSEHGASLDVLAVVDWSQSPQVPVHVRPVDTHVSFRKDRTYWLVGLTGSLGLSLCEWMVQRGARHFLMTSRHPKHQEAWLNEMKNRGACITIRTCDVTSKEQIEAVHKEAVSHLPPIAGVAQGAMVLQDTALQDMSLDKFLAATKPKVEGSIHLNNLFQDNTLDFFIFFSSISSVVGNFGQANYAAANSFMVSLAKKRRRQGLAASVMHIGPIFGVGYINRMNGGVSVGENILRRVGSSRISERQFHQHFAEAVLAGQSGSNVANIEIVTGLTRAVQQHGAAKPWQTWPRMSHMVASSHGSPATVKAGHDPSRASMKDQLCKANTRKQVFDIIWHSFRRVLGAQFHINIGKVSEAELGIMRFDEMGIDSLGAVDIRAWFMESLEVKVAVWTILNGASVNEVVTMASEEIPPGLVPNLDCGGATRIHGDAASMTSHKNMHTGSGAGDSQPKVVSTLDGGLDAIITKSIPVSFTQSRFYPSGPSSNNNKVDLNHTLWARIHGDFSAQRLDKAVQTVGQQHEILRTAFFDDEDGKPMQHIMNRSRLHLEQLEVEDESDVARIGMSIQKTHVYNVARGDTLRVILLNGQAGQQHLIVGAHPLVLDATSLIKFFNLLATNYANPNVPAGHVKQFAEVSQQQHDDYAQGKFQIELEYWKREFSTPPPPLPLLSLCEANERPDPAAYENVRSTCTIEPETRKYIVATCNRLRVTPFHFYLAVFRTVLVRYTVGGEDVTIAVAESGRGHDAQDMDVLGCLYNLILIRLVAESCTRFDDLLTTVRDKTYGGLANSKVPYPVVSKELKLQETANYAPFFQAFIDYRMGQRKQMPLGPNNMLEFLDFDLNLPYDVYLDIVDGPDFDGLHNLFLRKDLFDDSAAAALAHSYKALIERFAQHPELTLGEVDLSI